MLLKTLVVLCLAVASSVAVDYCKLNCGDTKHVACNTTVASGGWGDKCKDQELLNMTEEYQNSLLDVHNKYRNLQALGNISHYEPAVRMAKMRWDADLAFTAECNVRSCVFAHDGCSKTEKYSAVGQNLVMLMTNADWDRKITTDRIVELVKGWFDENENGEQHGWMDMINDLSEKQFDSSLPAVGHFTQFVRDTAEAIGCAAVFTTQTDDSGNESGAFILTCNYSYVNVLGTPVYVAGETAKNCTTGHDDTYPGLCSINEDFSY